MTTSEIRARTAAVFLGLGLFLFGATLAIKWFGDNERLLFGSDFVAYSIAGLVLGLIWPNSGWRLGLYLVAVWPCALVLTFFLAGEQPIILSRELKYLGGYLLVFLGACGGAGLGSLIAGGLFRQFGRSGNGVIYEASFRVKDFLSRPRG